MFRRPSPPLALPASTAAPTTHHPYPTTIRSPIRGHALRDPAAASPLCSALPFLATCSRASPRACCSTAFSRAQLSEFRSGSKAYGLSGVDPGRHGHFEGCSAVPTAAAAGSAAAAAAAAAVEVRMSAGSERASAACGLGTRTVAFLQADCIRVVRTWCKLGAEDHLAVQLTHQLPATARPGLLSAAAASFNGPDGRRHALIALSLALVTAAAGNIVEAAAAVSDSKSSLSLSPVATSITALEAAPAAVAATTNITGAPQPPLLGPLGPLEGVVLHWGCCHGPGQRWYGGAPGWHTLPAVSYDAGGGAWQTPFVVRQAILLDPELGSERRQTDPASLASSSDSRTQQCQPSSQHAEDLAEDRRQQQQDQVGAADPWVAVYSLVLQLPWEGPIRHGGVAFVLKTAQDQWIKAVPAEVQAGDSRNSGHGSAVTGSSTGSSTGGIACDFWIDTSDLPLVAGGMPLLPDVFRTTNCDNLPLVFPSLPATADANVLAIATNGFIPTSARRHANTSAAAATIAHASGQAAPQQLPTTQHQPQPLQPQPHSQPLQRQRAHPQEGVTTPPPRISPLGTTAGDDVASDGFKDLLAVAAAFIPPPRPSDALLRSAERWPLPADRPVGHSAGSAAAAEAARQWMVELVAQREPGAERSLMHRYNAGAELVGMLLAAGEASAAAEGGEEGGGGGAAGALGNGAGGSSRAAALSDVEVEAALAVLTAWFRFSSSRQLVWNRNYNVKPREVAAAQSRLAAALAALGAARGPRSSSSGRSSSSSGSSSGRGSSDSITNTSSSSSSGSSGGSSGGRHGSAGVGALVRVALAAVGRGGSGEVGQRIRDEILAIQHRNGCKGGMLEEWHQKLHNNTSPDDVAICRALLDYIAAGLDLRAYWATLHAAGISAQRLASFERPIRSEPRFSGQQAAGLQRDLGTYLQTLRAVHEGADLRSAVGNVLGLQQRDMKGRHISIAPAPRVASPQLATHLRVLLALQTHLASGAAAAAGVAGAAPPSATPAAAATGLARPSDVASLVGLPGAVRFMEMAVEARHMIRPFLDDGEETCADDRLVDVAFLDLALDSAIRTALEGHMTAVRQLVAEATLPYINTNNKNQDHDDSAAAASSTSFNGAAAASAAAAAFDSSAGGGDKDRDRSGGGGLEGHEEPVAGAQAASEAFSRVLEVLRLAVENAALSAPGRNEELVAANKWLRLLAAQADPRVARDRMLQSLSLVERLQRALAAQAGAVMGLMQRAAEQLGGRLGVAQEAARLQCEEAVRGGAAAPLAQLLGRLEPQLRRATGGGVWQIVSRGGTNSSTVVAGRMRVEPDLSAVQHEIMTQPTVLLVEGITGAEEIPTGCVAVLVAAAGAGGADSSGGGGSGGGGGVPDVLSHSAVRARNLGVLLAGCHCPELVARMRSHAGARVMVRLEGPELHLSFSSSSGSSSGGGISVNGSG